MTVHLSRGALRERTNSNVAFREATGAGDNLDVVKNVILLRAGPGNLGDRHYYTPAALQDAVTRQIFEGAQAYLDHPSMWDENNQPGRSVRQLAGWYSDVTCREYADPVYGKTVALYADFHPAVGKADVLTIVRTCLEYAKRYPRMAWAGLSINAMGDSMPDTIDGEEWNRVDRIELVESIDIVTRAGAGGTLVPLKESYRMKTTRTKEKDVKLTLDVDAVKEGVTKLFESGKAASKAAIVKMVEAAKGGAKVTPDEDAEIDRQLGIVDGGKIDKVLDDATGVEEDEPTTEGADPTVEAGDEEDVEAMSDDPAFLKKKIKKERAARIAAETKVTEAAKRVTEAERQAGTVVRERMAENVLVELNIPDTFRPRLKHELVTGGFVHEKGMREHAQAFDKAFIRPQLDGAGVVVNGRAREGAASLGNFNFDEEG